MRRVEDQSFYSKSYVPFYGVEKARGLGAGSYWHSYARLVVKEEKTFFPERRSKALSLFGQAKRGLLIRGSRIHENVNLAVPFSLRSEIECYITNT